MRRAASLSARASVEVAEGYAGLGGEVGEGGDLAGEAAQVGGVVAGPGGDGAVGGAARRGWPGRAVRRWFRRLPGRTRR